MIWLHVIYAINNIKIMLANTPQNSEMNITILKHKNLCKCDHPFFSPKKSLYYFSFIEKVPQRPMRIKLTKLMICKLATSKISHLKSELFLVL